MSDFDTSYRYPTSPLDEAQPQRNGVPPSAAYAPYLESPYADPFGAERLTVAIVGPDDQRRNAVAIAIARCPGAVVREFHRYPNTLDGVPGLLEGN